MIKMMTAFTEEVDEVEDGLAEILGQIDLGGLKKNSVGLITCHYDFVNSGFLGELCGKLPFDVIGTTTMASSNQHGQSMYALSLTVLTSDDVVFKTAMSKPLDSNDYRDKIDLVYKEAVGKLGGRPSLIISFFPFIKELSGAPIHKCLDEVCGGVPFWGSVATNIDVSYEQCFTFCKDNVERNGLAMLLMHGELDPEFIVVSMPGKNISKTRGQITSSDGCLLKGINGIAPIKYLESLGVIIMKDASITTPLMVYYEGSTEPVALTVYNVYDDGSLLCGGEMTEGASLAVGEITTESILASAGEGIDRLLKSGKRNGVLMLPCVSRYVMLAPNRGGEMDLIADKMENGRLMPYMVGYAGGEICPVRDEAGVLRNRFHNFSFTVCVL